jgi:hypothetical protein
MFLYLCLKMRDIDCILKREEDLPVSWVQLTLQLFGVFLPLLNVAAVCNLHDFLRNVGHVPVGALIMANKLAKNIHQITCLCPCLSCTHSQNCRILILWRLNIKSSKNILTMINKIIKNIYF